MQNRNNVSHHLYEAIRLVRPLHLNVHRFVEHLLSSSDLTVTDRAVLEAIIETGPSTVPEVSRLLSLKRQQVERAVTTLTQANLIERSDNPAHKRARLCAATTAGTQMFNTLHQTELDAVLEMCNDLDPNEIDAAARVLAAIDERFRAAVRELDEEKSA